MASIIDGLFAGRAGIQSHGTAIAVLGDNIANQNTVGFKAARADFVDLLAGSLGSGGAVSTGSGSSASKITRILTQGTFEFTGRGLDLGIDGNGYLTLQNEVGSTFYTRAGNLQVDPDGNLLDQNGYYVMGYPSGGQGNLERLNVNERVSGDIGTSEIAISGNLNAAETDRPQITGGGPYTYSDLNNLSHYQQQVTVFDSLGGEHVVNAYFTKTATSGLGNTWEATFFANNSDTTIGTPANSPTIVTGGTVTLDFNSAGQMTSTGLGNIGPINWANGAASSTFGVDLSGFAQFASPSSTGSLSQNGTGSGSVTGFSVDKSGLLFAQLDNGQSSDIGTIALATFSNPEGLTRQGNSLFSQSKSSGEAISGRPGIGNFGEIQSGALELSTSDLAADFIKLISLQRGFQGSSRVVSSINDLLSEIVNLAR